MLIKVIALDNAMRESKILINPDTIVSVLPAEEELIIGKKSFVTFANGTHIIVKSSIEDFQNACNSSSSSQDLIQSSIITN